MPYSWREKGKDWNRESDDLPTVVKFALPFQYARDQESQMKYGKALWSHVRMSCWLMQPRFCSGPVGSGECCQPNVPCRSGRFRPCGAELQEDIGNAEQIWATGAFYPAVWTIADSFHLWSPHCFGAWLCESCLFDTVQSRRVFELAEVRENCWECDWFRIYPLH